MSSRTAASALTLAAFAATAALAPLATPVAAQAAEGATCTVTDGTLSWGFKESYRSYVSGSIANGSWEAGDGATYETPLFTWSGAHGDIDAFGHGEIAFAGSVVFTGHGGVMQTTIANPVVVLDDTGARLLLDVGGISMEDATSGADVEPQTSERVAFADLGLDASRLDWASGVAAATDIPATVAPAGYEAFANYETGTALDPVSFDVVSTCETPVDEPVETAAPAAETPDAGTLEKGVTWLPWAIGGGAVVVAAVIAGVLIGRRRGTASNAPDADRAGDDPAGDSTDGIA